ncbi:MAG: GNAT family N-acetyltransferase [Ruminococcus sp.]|nr:GNAT family N-acetyltransferase [Ruminococcus sp.]
MKVLIRQAVPEDAAALLKIYAYYVKNTAITFEYEVPTEEEFRQRIADTLEKYPFVIAETEGVPVGYAYAGPFKGRRAYDWSAELAVYADKNFQNCGIGKLLYTELEEILSKMGVTNLYASIAVPEEDDEYLTKNSIGFHRHMGYENVGHFHKCGYKFGRWYDMVWAEKIIGSHFSNQPEIVNYNNIKKK